MTFVILESLVLFLCWLKLEEEEVEDEKEVEEDDEDVEEVPFHRIFIITNRILY